MPSLSFSPWGKKNKLSLACLASELSLLCKAMGLEECVKAGDCPAAFI